MDEERMDRLLSLAWRLVILLEDRENRMMLSALMILARLLEEFHNESNVCDRHLNSGG